MSAQDLESATFPGTLPAPRASVDGREATIVYVGLLLTVFLGALLLFAVEPMIAKMILPWFGGTAEVWTACLLFFQSALLAGYLYAHLLIRWFTPAWQRRIHVTLVAISLVVLPVVPSASWKPTGAEDPLFLILGLLTATIGPTYVLLAATSPLMQSWLAQGNTGGPARSPYRMFALSNFGSLLALLSYPVVIEPILATGTQARLWSFIYLGFVVVCAGTAWLTRVDSPSSVVARRTPSAPAVGFVDRVLWFSLAACASTLLLAVTNHMSQNVAAIPLFWVVPLGLYLLSFILCFESARWYRPTLFYILFAELAAGMLYGASGNYANSTLFVLVPLYSVGLFVGCMVCHGELAALRPQVDGLTGFYLIVALGGAAGGIFVGAVAPAIFPGLYELPLALCTTALLVVFVAWRRSRSASRSGQPIVVGALAACLIAVLYTGYSVHRDASGTVLLARNFYGALQVVDRPATAEKAEVLRFMHGTIAHGEQFVDPARAMEPTTYYSKNSGVGLAVDDISRGAPVNIGFIGLGVGTLAAYGRSGDTYRFYEINPLVYDIAKGRFSFLQKSRAHTSVTLGDGRLRLESEAPQDFDMLVADAFSGDAVPVHLLTKEAFALYWRHLKPHGVLAINVSNQYLNLAPVVAKIAALNGKTARLMTNQADPVADSFMAEWVLVADAAFFARPAFAAAQPIAIPANLAPWSDDYSNLWRHLR